MYGRLSVGIRQTKNSACWNKHVKRMPNFKVNLRKRELGDSFEMVLDPFMFNMDMTALADVANALVDTGASKTCIGLDVVKKLQLQPVRKEAIDTATSGNEEVGVYKLLLSLSPGHFLPIEVYGIPNPKAEAVIIGMDVLGLGDLHIWKEGKTHRGTFFF